MPSTRAIGVDAGGTKLLAGVVDEAMAVHHKARRLWAGGGRDEVLATIEAAVEEALAAAPDAAAIGFGIPSLVEHRSGRSLSSVHLPLDGLAVRDHMSERFGLPVYVDNDATAAVVCEHRGGAGRGRRNVVLLTLGTGVGGGLVLDDRVYRGSVGAGGELGHVVVDVDGPPCFGDCPGRGCLEALVSGSALARDGAAAARAAADSALGRAVAEGREISGTLVTEAAMAGDPTAEAVVRNAGRMLGVGIAGFINVFDPDVVIVGGGVMAAGELLLEPARAEAAARVLPVGRDRAPIVPAAFGEAAGMVGAAMLALDLVDSGERTVSQPTAP